MRYTDAVLAVDELPVARRAAALEMLSEVLRLEREVASVYLALAARPGPAPLRAACGEIAAQTVERIPTIEALAREAGLEAMPGVSPASTAASGPDGRGELFGQVFERERALETAYRDLAVLLGDPTRCPSLPTLLAEAIRRRARLRDLYVRYS